MDETDSMLWNDSLPKFWPKLVSLFINLKFKIILSFAPRDPCQYFENLQKAFCFDDTMYLESIELILISN